MEQKVLETDYTNKITVMDEPGADGACHRYLVSKNQVSLCFVKFQEGPIGEFGVTGCQNEDLLAIVADRLECFQAGDYACEENGKALKAVKEAIQWSRRRMADRKSRGVEGTSKK